jgi:hypothetical protein
MLLTIFTKIGYTLNRANILKGGRKMLNNRSVYKLVKFNIEIKCTLPQSIGF